ncbi:hypothetical protein F4861DRAFT_314495 [Xylaria intraflava]|nr:hypothetical protein F4861DRAFT_314495 [Xylaria intraflava]
MPEIFPLAGWIVSVILTRARTNRMGITRTIVVYRLFQKMRGWGLRMVNLGGQQPHKTMSSNRAVCTELQPSMPVNMCVCWFPHMIRRLV